MKAPAIKVTMAIMLLAVASVLGAPFNRLLEGAFNNRLKIDLLSVFPFPGVGEFPVQVKDHLYFVGARQISIYVPEEDRLEQIGNYFFPERVARPHGGWFTTFPMGLRWPVLEGNRLYLGNYGELLVLDVANPAAPILLGRADKFFVYQTQRFDVKNNLVFHIGSTNNSPFSRHFIVTDFSNVAAPRALAALPTLGVQMSPVSSGRTLLVGGANGTAYLDLVDVSDPANPRVESGFEIPWNFSGLIAYRYSVLNGNIAYLVLGDNKVHIVDFSNPASPQASSRNASGAWGQPVIVGSTLFVPGRQLLRFDITNPLQLTPLSSLPHVLSHGSTGLFGERLVVRSQPSAGTAGISVYAQPANTIPRFSTNVPSIAETAFPGGILAAHGSKVVFRNEIVDFADPRQPVRTPKPGIVPLSAIIGTNGYRFTHSSVIAYDATHPLEPVFVKSYPFRIEGGWLNGDVWVVGTNYYDLSSIHAVARVATPRLDADGSSFYLAARVEDWFFWVAGDEFIVTRKASPEIVARLSLAGEGVLTIGPILASHGVVIVQRSFRTEHPETLEWVHTEAPAIIDVRDPLSPRLFGAPFNPGILQPAGDFLVNFGNTQDDILEFYRFADPVTPELAGAVTLPGSMLEMLMFRSFGTRILLGSHLVETGAAGVPEYLGRVPLSEFPSTISSFGDVLLTADLQRVYALQISRTLTAADSFDEGSNAGWHRFDRFGLAGHGTIVVRNGVYELSTPASPVPAMGPATVGALRPDLNFSDSRQEIEVTGWLNSSEDAPVINLQARSASHPDGTADFYAASFSPSPFKKIMGTPLSKKPSFSILRATRSKGVPMAVVEFPDDTFDPAKTYRLTFEVDSTLLDATLAEMTADGPVILGRLQATDSAFSNGYCGFHVLDRNGHELVGNRPVQITADNYSAAGIPVGPNLRIDRQGRFYFSVAGEAVLEWSADLVRWEPAEIAPETGADGLVRTATLSPGSMVRFYRLKM